MLGGTSKSSGFHRIFPFETWETCQIPLEFLWRADLRPVSTSLSCCRPAARWFAGEPGGVFVALGEVGDPLIEDHPTKKGIFHLRYLVW